MSLKNAKSTQLISKKPIKWVKSISQRAVHRPIQSFHQQSPREHRHHAATEKLSSDEDDDSEEEDR